ncbi:MAG TPA: BlaI/MecI/CopY family transcriptional regulator [Bacillota bacterium]|nr:BlaI/MecI/CopY family transcriptional regulator [Candidatus Fermentithermobacillaceae bacterium]HOA70790.1 BlaI/MecI/CopY family transcriptional regulator [Bacillota bacterium]HOP70522.1 BlaI/MecI/CopY family transcriptional regulator [Bacillota bacterium]HPT35863.1 BlaI/MecI/CopY family transcriptional regulator [Bacillota bacterium]HPZ85154.1 BlaI/MecI/CopY family transcriptional regulator [Bacillota bacterium]
MNKYRLGKMERRFAELIWDTEPINSGDLVKLCAQQFGWKKSTTYTMLKRLCDRGLFKNENAVVSALMTREEFLAHQSERFLNETFDGSLPLFLAAFSRRKRLTEREISELQDLIDRYKAGLKSRDRG